MTKMIGKVSFGSECLVNDSWVVLSLRGECHIVLCFRDSRERISSM